MNNEVETQNDDKKDKKQPGKRGLPRLPLQRTLELVRAVYELGYGDAVPRSYALDHLGRKPGGASNTLVGAATDYGLLKATDGKLELTDRGRQYADPDSAGTQQLSAALDAIYSDEIFTSFMVRHENKGTVPSDRTAILFLQNQGLSEDDAKSYWEVIQVNLMDHGLAYDSPTGTRLLRTRSSVQPKQDSRDEKIEVNDYSEPVEVPVPTPAPRVVTSSFSNATPSNIAPEFHFNIQIHLPADAEPDKYDAIFRSIATHLLGRNDTGE
jgi:hypothetical protein